MNNSFLLIKLFWKFSSSANHTLKQILCYIHKNQLVYRLIRVKCYFSDIPIWRHSCQTTSFLQDFSTTFPPPWTIVNEAVPWYATQISAFQTRKSWLFQVVTKDWQICWLQQQWAGKEISMNDGFKVFATGTLLLHSNKMTVFVEFISIKYERLLEIWHLLFLRNYMDHFEYMPCSLWYKLHLLYVEVKLFYMYLHSRLFY